MANNLPDLIFTKEFTKQESLPAEAVERANELLQSGRLHRYNNSPGEESDVALLEREFADYVGSKYCVALSSCGSSARSIVSLCPPAGALFTWLSNALVSNPAIWC